MLFIWNFTEKFYNIIYRIFPPNKFKSQVYQIRLSFLWTKFKSQLFREWKIYCAVKVWSLLTLTSQRCQKYQIYLNSGNFIILHVCGIWMGLYNKFIILVMSYDWMQTVAQKVVLNFIQIWRFTLNSNTSQFLWSMIRERNNKVELQPC